MKLKHLFFNALVVMAFAACSNEAEEIKPVDKSTTATLELDMTGQYGAGSQRALSLDGSEYPRFIHEEGVTNWQTHCFIRNEEGTVQFYALVDWNATTNEEDGSISLHIKDSKLTLQNSAGSDVTATETLPKAGEEWYIAGIAGGGALDDTKSNVNFAYLHALDIDLSHNQARIPLAFGWTRFTIPANNQQAPRIVVQFKPQGTLFSVRVNNRTNPLQTKLKCALVAETNAFSREGQFDYSLTATRTDYASAPKWSFWYQGTEIFNAREITMEANEAKNVYFWAMPRTEVPSESFTTTLSLNGYNAYADGTQNKPTADTRQYQTGKTYAQTGLDVGTLIHFWEHLPPYNVAPDGQSFVTTSAQNVSGYWTWQEAVEKFKNITIDGVQYMLPGPSMWRAIIPSGYSASSSNGYIRFNFESAEDNKMEYVSARGWGRYYLSSYRGSLNNESYGLRFWTADGDYSRLTAVRYQYVDNPLHSNTTRKMLKVTFRYLGPTASATTVDEIANAAYWESNNENDITFDFPASGRIRYTDGTEEYGGAVGFFWAQGDTTSDVAYNMLFTGRDAQVATGAKAHKQSVRLFKVKP